MISFPAYVLIITLSNQVIFPNDPATFGFYNKEDCQSAGIAVATITNDIEATCYPWDPFKKRISGDWVSKSSRGN